MKSLLISCVMFFLFAIDEVPHTLANAVDPDMQYMQIVDVTSSESVSDDYRYEDGLRQIPETEQKAICKQFFKAVSIFTAILLAIYYGLIK